MRVTGVLFGNRLGEGWNGDMWQAVARYAGLGKAGVFGELEDDLASSWFASAILNTCKFTSEVITYHVSVN